MAYSQSKPSQITRPPRAKVDEGWGGGGKLGKGIVNRGDGVYLV